MMKSTNAEVWSCYASGCGALTVRKDKASERDLREKMNGERQRVVFDEGYSTYEGAKALRDACHPYMVVFNQDCANTVLAHPWRRVLRDGHVWYQDLARGGFYRIIVESEQHCAVFTKDYGDESEVKNLSVKGSLLYYTRYEDRLSLVIASDIRERCMGRDIGDVPYLPCYQEWCKAVGLKPGPFIG
jgi:hypothetical protein